MAGHKDQPNLDGEVIHLILRDGTQCAYCRKDLVKPTFSRSLVTRDHVISRFFHGENQLWNMVFCCVYCNRLKCTIENRMRGMFPKDYKPNDFGEVFQRAAMSFLKPKVPPKKGEPHKTRPTLDVLVQMCYHVWKVIEENGEQYAIRLDAEHTYARILAGHQTNLGSTEPVCRTPAEKQREHGSAGGSGNG